MTLIVNGVDLMPYLAEGGYKLTRADGDGPNAGRTLDYMMYRARVGTKYRLDATLLPLKKEAAYRILPALMPEYVSVTYTNAFLGQDVTTEMYSNNNVATIRTSYNGEDLWDVEPIALVER